MPLSARIARINRRLTNPVTRTFAGRSPLFGIVIHQGRKSGTTYRTPVNVFHTENGFIFALTYGPDTDWVKNVEAEGGCRLIYRGREIALAHPRFVHGEDGSRYMPALIRSVLQLVGVDEYLRMDRVPAN